MRALYTIPCHVHDPNEKNYTVDELGHGRRVFMKPTDEGRYRRQNGKDHDFNLDDISRASNTSKAGLKSVAMHFSQTATPLAGVFE